MKSCGIRVVVTPQILAQFSEPSSLVRDWGASGTRTPVSDTWRTGTLRGSWQL
ncbi:MAG: hypothetical protein JWN03_8442 [Nocardia sp.]|nr:hypothetical protein [Nocardia sp.]